jgi:hypothetical protein
METKRRVNRAVCVPAGIVVLGAFLSITAAAADGQGETPHIALATTTTLEPSLISSTYGQTVAFVATVASIGAVGPSGTVVFQDNGVTLGSLTLTGVEGTRTSQATFSTNALTAGPHSITASYQGNGPSAASESRVVPFTVGKGATFFSALDGDVTGLSVGNYIGLSALINFSGTIPPSGTVLFEDTIRNVTVGFVTLQSPGGNGLVNLSTNSLNAGSYNVTATYQGDANYLPCTSGALPFTIGQASAAFTLTPSNNPSSAGQPVTFTASYNSNGAPEPSGSVIYKDGATTLGSQTLTLGLANYTSSALSAGTHSITVVYGGDSNYKATTSSALTQKVNNASLSSTQTALVSSTNPSIIGQPVNLTATVTGSGGTPTGSVTFMDGSTAIISVGLTGGMAMFQDPSLSAGTHSLTAVYSGDTNYSGSTSHALSETIFSSPDATTTTVVSSVNPSSPGQSVTFTATVAASGGWVPGNDGFLTFWDGTTELGTVVVQNGKGSYPISTLALGAHSITANYGGDLVFSTSTSLALTQTVSNTITTTTSLASSANPSTAGQPVTFTATVTPAGPGAPTGTVTFKDGANTLGNGSLNNGRAPFTTSSLSAGPHSITAVYGGDTNFSGSTSGVLSQTVTSDTGGATSTSVSGSPNPATIGQTVTLTAIVTSSGSGTPTGTVTFEDGTTDLGAAPVSGGQAVLATAALSQGPHSITAVYSGDSSFTGSTSGVLTETVQASGASSPTSALAHFAAGATWTTGIFVVNTGNQAANFSIKFFDDAGNPATLPFTTGATSTLSGSVPANGSAYFEAANPLDALISGWGQITAGPSIVVQALFRNNINGAYYEAAVPSSSGGKEFLIPFDATTFAATNAQFYTGFAVANLDQSSANVSCIARDSSGTVIPNAVPVPALSPLGHWANYLFPALTGLRGTIDCSSNTNIAATALRFIGANAFSSLPVVTNPSSFSGAAQAALAHFAAGDTWTTGFFVLNTGAAPAQFSIAFHDDNGGLIALPFSTGASYSQSGTVPAHGSAYFEAGDPQAALISGSAEITADPTIVVQALFRNNSNGTYYEAAVPSSVGSKEFLFPFDATTFDGNGQPFYTGFAIANLEDSAGNVTCTARDQNGVVIPNAVPVPVMSNLGHWANYLFPALTGLRGTIDCVSDTNVAATALRFIGANAFSSLPVITK